MQIWEGATANWPLASLSAVFWYNTISRSYHRQCHTPLIVYQKYQIKSQDIGISYYIIYNSDNSPSRSSRVTLTDNHLSVIMTIIKIRKVLLVAFRKCSVWSILFPKNDNEQGKLELLWMLKGWVLQMDFTEFKHAKLWETLVPRGWEFASPTSLLPPSTPLLAQGHHHQPACSHHPNPQLWGPVWRLSLPVTSEIKTELMKI